MDGEGERSVAGGERFCVAVSCVFMSWHPVRFTERSALEMAIFYFYYFGALCSAGCQQKKERRGTQKKKKSPACIRRATTHRGGGEVSPSDGEKTDDGAGRLILCI